MSENDHGSPLCLPEAGEVAARTLQRRCFLRTAAASAGALAAGIPALAHPPPPPPKIYCPPYPKHTSLAIKVCDIHHGFELQWVSKQDYEKYGWSRPCWAKFYRHEIPLDGNGCFVVDVGDFPKWREHDVDTNCPGPLQCGTEYYFRARSLAKYPDPDGPFGEKIKCATKKCQCTYTQGYWKNHPEAWPVASLKLGSVTYTREQLLAILRTPVRGNGLISLAHQLIAAKLNVANGADPRAVAGAIARADALIGGLRIPPYGSGYLHPSQTGALTTVLADYNEGRIGPGHCDENRAALGDAAGCGCTLRT